MIVQETGVTVNVNGSTFNVRGTIAIVSADNLASWSVGGYKALASANRKCHFCMATSNDIKSKVYHYICKIIPLTYL